MRKLVPAIAILSGCTTLGPMPITTGVTALPARRPSAEIGLGATPGYYLSSGVTENPRGAPLPQLSALFEPDRVLSAPGLIAGARLCGTSDAGTFLEPMLGYRQTLPGDGRVSLGGVVYGTHSSKSERQASYAATRVGVEVATDTRLTPESRWAEVHVLAGVALTGLWADGSYCVDSDRKYGIDCPEPPDGPGTMAQATIDGAYPSVHAGIALELGRHLPTVFHGGRLSLVAAGASMPTLVSGKQDHQLIGSLGLALSVALGAAR